MTNILFFISLIFNVMNLFQTDLRRQQLIEKNWKLVWSDEFDYEGLPDHNKWSQETGFVRGFEEQFYTKSRSENAFVKDGYLTIVAKKERYKNPKFIKSENVPNYKIKHDSGKVPNHIRNTADSVVYFTSASLTTLGKASWRYGKIEVRAKLPTGAGMWPAIWMLGTNRSVVGWPKCGEIDILEHKGSKPNRIYGSAHFYDFINRKRIVKNQFKDVSAQLHESFHRYTIEWDENEIKFFFDELNYHTVKNDTETFKKPFYLLINFALGGGFGGELDERFLPQKFLIDYVRVYQ